MTRCGTLRDLYDHGADLFSFRCDISQLSLVFWTSGSLISSASSDLKGARVDAVALVVVGNFSGDGQTFDNFKPFSYL